MLGNSENASTFSRDYVFTCRAGDLASFLNNIIYDIGNAVPRQIAFIESKCRLIVTELLTNALKHSTTNSTIFSISIDSEKLRITKVDQGRPFYLEAWKEREALVWPLDRYQGRKLVIYEDMMCCLYGYIENPNKIVFTTKDFPISTPPRPKEILEHFGLMIMTKASDSFIYWYNPESGENVFQAVMHFDDGLEIDKHLE